MSRSFIGLACIAVSALLPAPVVAQTLSTVRVTTIDPTVDEFGDLETLERDIGDARIVMLGEPSHGEGGAFIAKARVIRFLHERMGFDVLAFEGGIGVLSLAEEAVQAGEAPSAALMRSVLPVWGRSDQLKPLGDSLDRDQRLGDPLTLAGFDKQEVGPAAADLADSVEGLGGRAPDGAEIFSRLGVHLRAMAPGGMRALRERDLTTVSEDVAVARSAVASLPAAEASRPLAPSEARRTSWMLGYQPLPARWDRTVDGVFFIREMTPTTCPREAGSAQGG